MSDAVVASSDLNHGCHALPLGSAEVANEAPDSYAAYFSDGSRHTPGVNDAYVHVRVTQTKWPSGSVTVYLPDGTALVVPSRDLIHLAHAGVGWPVTEPACDPDR